MIALSPRNITAVEFSSQWKVLESNIQNLFVESSTQVTEMELYHQVYTICIAPGELWKILQKNIITLITSHCKSITSSYNELILHKYLNDYHSFDVALKRVEKICRYLSLYYLNESFTDFGKRCWREVVYVPHCTTLIQSIIEVIHDIRNKKSECKILLNYKDAILSLGSSTQTTREYYESFEDAYINDFQKYVSTISGLDDKYFLENVTSVETLEMNNIWNYLEISTKTRGKKVMNELWIEKIDVVSDLLVDGLNEDDYIIEMLYKGIQNSVDPVILEALRKVFSNWILSLAYGKLDRFSGNRDEWVESLICILKQVSACLEKLHNDLSFIQTAQITIKSILSSAPHEFTQNNPVFIAMYIHDSLRHSKAQTYRLTNPPLLHYSATDALELVSYLQERDLFEEWYCKLLAKRLLTKEIQNEKAEETIINRLRELSGASYATKLGRMFSDISSSISLTEDFNKLCKCPQLDVSVVTGGTWPLHPSDEVELPFPINDILNSFTYYYTSKFEGRKLQWVHSVSTATLQWEYNHTMKTATLPGLAGIIILHTANGSYFEKKGEILTMYNALIKAEVLDETGNITDNFLNGSYKTIGTNEQQNESHIKEDRTAWGEAACVRVIKRIKKCRTNDLIKMVIKQKAPFLPTEQFVLNVIEKLIEKEYIERDKKDSELLHYMY
ncbi:Cullin [Entamoeba marina]